MLGPLEDQFPRAPLFFWPAIFEILGAISNTAAHKLRGISYEELVTASIAPLRAHIARKQAEEEDGWFPVIFSRCPNVLHAQQTMGAGHGRKSVQSEGQM